MVRREVGEEKKTAITNKVYKIDILSHNAVPRIDSENFISISIEKTISRWLA